MNSVCVILSIRLSLSHICSKSVSVKRENLDEVGRERISVSPSKLPKLLTRIGWQQHNKHICFAFHNVSEYFALWRRRFRYFTIIKLLKIAFFPFCFNYFMLILEIIFEVVRAERKLNDFAQSHLLLLMCSKFE